MKELTESGVRQKDRQCRDQDCKTYFNVAPNAIKLQLYYDAWLEVLSELSSGLICTIYIPRNSTI